MKKNITKILLMIAVITVCIGAKVYADYIMNASEVEYTKSDSTKVSVKAALDDLYTKSQQVSQIENFDMSVFSGLVFSHSSIGLTYAGSQSVTITNPNGLEIAVETSDSTVATVTKNSNTQITINAKSKEGSAVITAKATVDGATFVVKKIGVGVWSGSGTMSVATAKNIITPENISAYIGTPVSYSPTAGGTWHIFYLDTKNKYGDGAGTLYIKRYYDSSKTLSISTNSTSASYYTNASNKAEVLADMKKFNPEWGTNDGAIGNVNENHSAYMCHRNNTECAQYVQSGVGQYAVLSPSVEMYMDAYNQWGGYTSTTGPQSYKWQSTSVSGYNVGVNGSYPNTGYQNFNSLSTGPNNIFMTSKSDWWLASPACYGANYVLYVDGTYAFVRYGANPVGVCPVVSLGS